MNANLKLNTTVLNKFLRQHQRFKKILLLLIHLFVFACAYILAFFFRVNFEFQVESELYYDTYAIMWKTILPILLIKIPVFWYHHHFGSQWFYASTKDLRMIIKSSIYALLIIVIINTCLAKYIEIGYKIPRSIPILDFCLTIFILGGLRLTWRYFSEDVLPFLNGVVLERTLLVGANHEGGCLCSLINGRHDLGFQIVGFLTVHPEKVNSQLGHIPILGSVENAVSVAKKINAQNILVIAGILPGNVFRQLMDNCHEHNIHLKVIPKTEIQISEKIPMREINIDDLLKRDPIQLDKTRISQMIEGSCVLVTGGGGSIGSEICRQIMRFKPSKLILLGRGENRIFFIERELRALKSETELVPVIADISNEKRLDEIFELYRPEIVFHAAAHKHVPLMESNINEAIRNNIYGTKIVADTAEKYGVKTFVLISTDKAVNPTSVMGTSKHMAERYVHAKSTNSATKFIVTRFGNVLGSAGSVVPIFTQQIQKGGPITITDERMTRFFMTIPEAAQLVLEAAAMGKGGEIFVLDMGNPVKIIDLAKDMIRLAGLPEKAIDIQFTGLRPGEKLYEELYFENETTLPTEHPKLRAANHRLYDVQVVQNQIETLVSMMFEKDQEVLRRKLQEFVPEYHPYIAPALIPVNNLDSLIRPDKDKKAS